MKVFKDDIVECIKDFKSIKKGEFIRCVRDNYLRDIDLTTVEKDLLDFDKYFIKIKETFYKLKVARDWNEPYRLIDKRVWNFSEGGSPKRGVLLLQDNTYTLLSLEQFEEICEPINE